ncbi:GNAT family N-acetyltransferase [Microbacterium sp. NPDC003461]
MEHPATESALVADPLRAVDWPIRTERLLLRRVTPADIDAMWAFRRLPEVGMWIGGAPDTLDGHRARMRRNSPSLVSIVLPEEGTVIGDLMIKVEDAWAQAEVVAQARGVQAEIGWTLDPAFQGRGYATEAVRAAIGLCFGPLSLRRVTANCFATNEPSWRLMERLGMRREAHTVRDSLHRSGEWMDGLTYALLAEEWRG